MFKEDGYTVEELIEALIKRNVPKDYKVRFTTIYNDTNVRDWYLDEDDKEIVFCD